MIVGAPRVLAPEGFMGRRSSRTCTGGCAWLPEFQETYALWVVLLLSAAY